MMLAAVKPSPIFIGRQNNQSSWQIGMLALNSQATGTGLPQGWDLWTTWSRYQITQIRNKLLKASHKRHRAEQVPKCKYVPLMPLMRLCPPTINTEEWPSLHTSVGDWLLHAFSPSEALNLPLPMSRIPLSSSRLSQPILRASSKLQFSRDTCWCASEARHAQLCSATSFRGHTRIYILFIN